VRMSLEESGAETIGTMKAQVQLAGKAAAMGRGIIEDVSARLVQTFAQNLEGILASGGGDGGDAAAEPEASAAPEEKPAAAPEPSTGSGEAEAEADDDGLPVLPLVASMVADRMRDPRVLGGVLGGVLLLGYAIGRARG
jgi:hypothetical protein